MPITEVVSLLRWPKRLYCRQTYVRTYTLDNSEVVLPDLWYSQELHRLLLPPTRHLTRYYSGSNQRMAQLSKRSSWIWHTNTGVE